MSFWVCYYHVVWATRNREPLITAQVEPLIFATIDRKSKQLSCPILAMNGVDDHVHVAVAIPPKLAVADWVRQVKGLSGREVNAMFPDAVTPFHWQHSYGVLTFGARSQSFVVDYIQHQKEHHQNNTLAPYLERIDSE